jgi:hypothetical protein
MIPKQEILQIATAINLSAQVIEKDYVLGSSEVTFKYGCYPHFSFLCCFKYESF